jgi:TM2 domain-containing membrane protein YozV
MLEALLLRQIDVERREDELREQVARLPDPDRADFYRRYEQQIKDPDTYAVLNWFFLAGLHHFYLHRYIRGTTNLLLMLAGIALLFIQPAVGSGLIVVILLLEVPALFRSQIIVADYNVTLGSEIMVQTYSNTTHARPRAGHM